jgi:hypothetical protein
MSDVTLEFLGLQVERLFEEFRRLEARREQDASNGE